MTSKSHANDSTMFELQVISLYPILAAVRCKRCAGIDGVTSSVSWLACHCMTLPNKVLRSSPPLLGNSTRKSFCWRSHDTLRRETFASDIAFKTKLPFTFLGTCRECMYASISSILRGVWLAFGVAGVTLSQLESSVSCEWGRHSRRWWQFQEAFLI